MGDSPIKKTGQTPIYGKQVVFYHIFCVNVKTSFYVKWLKGKEQIYEGTENLIFFLSKMNLRSFSWSN
jgi:hypothetical protein